MPAETDKFIVSCFALWAGDFEYFEKLLREYSNPSDVAPIEEVAETPEDFIRSTGALRLRQLWQKRGEFQKFAAEYTTQGVEISDKPIIMETQHLRATLWRTSSREFSMHGYLKDLSWQEGLFAHARRLAEVVEQPRRKGLAPRGHLFATEPEGDPFSGRGVAWVVAENPFIQAELTDLGLVEATGIWTRQKLPETATAITQPFLKLLQRLDAPSQNT